MLASGVEGTHGPPGLCDRLGLSLVRAWQWFATVTAASDGHTVMSARPRPLPDAGHESNFDVRPMARTRIERSGDHDEDGAKNPNRVTRAPQSESSWHHVISEFSIGMRSLVKVFVGIILANAAHAFLITKPSIGLIPSGYTNTRLAPGLRCTGMSATDYKTQRDELIQV